jgi:HEPN domain-containing protein
VFSAIFRVEFRQAMTRHDVLDLLRRIEKEPAEREQKIREFQEYVMSADGLPDFDDSESEVLADLAYDLDYYVENPDWRREDAAYYGDERLVHEIRESMSKLRT